MPHSRIGRNLSTFRFFLVLALVAVWGRNATFAATGSNPARWSVLLSAPVLHRPWGLAIDGRGSLHGTKWAYTTDIATGRVIKFGTGGRVIASWKYGAPNRGEVSIAVGGSGNVFLALRRAGMILKFSPSGRLLARWSAPDNPAAIAIDYLGHVFEADASTRMILERTPAGDIVRRVDLAAGFPRSVCMPCKNPGNLGTPTGLGILTPGPALWFSTTRPAPVGSTVPGSQMDTLATLHFNLYHSSAATLGIGWTGLMHSTDGTPTQAPEKESEPFAAIQSLTSSRRGIVYIAGTLKFFTGGEGHGVMAYADRGYWNGPWYLPSSAAVHGLAVDPQGFVYVVQGSQILKLPRTRGN